MPTTPSVQPDLYPRIEPDEIDPIAAGFGAPFGPAYPETPPPALPPRHENDARNEIDRLRSEVEALVRIEGDVHARDAIDSALAQVTRLQIVTANLDACRPPAAKYAGAALVALADARLTGHPDAIERGMTYTADNQMRLLQNRE